MATNGEIQDMWRHLNSQNTKERLKTATEAWEARPFLTKSQENTCTMWQANIAKDSVTYKSAHAKSAYKIIELVGRFTAEVQ